MVRWKHNRLTQIQIRKEPTGLAQEPLAGAYLLEELTACGATKFMPTVGEVSLDWADIWHYHLATERLPDAYDRIIVKELSDEFMVGKIEGTDPLNIAPADRIKDE